MSRRGVRVIAVGMLLALPFVVFANGQQEGDEGPVQLSWIMGNPGQVPPDQADVEEVLNQLSVQEVGAEVTTLYYDAERTRLALTSGEDFDMVFAAGWWIDFPTQARSGNLADITEPLQEVTPDLYNVLPEFVWDGAKIDGRIHAIPVKKDYAAELFYRFDKEVFVDTLGMDIPQLPDGEMTFAGVERYLEAAKEAYEDGVLGPEREYPLMLPQGGFPGLDGNFDRINQTALLGIPYSAAGTDESATVVVYWEHPDLIERFEKLHEWFEAGYINPDAATTTDLPVRRLVKVQQGYYGADAEWSAADGYAQVISRFQGPYLSTSSVRGAMNAISAGSDNIEMALRYQEFVNTDPTYRDILRFGIEGVHWEPAGEGLVRVTETGRNRYAPWGWAQGAVDINSVAVAEGVESDPNMWQVIFAGYEDLEPNNSIGFAFDISPVESQVAAIGVIRDKYYAGLYTGTLDPAEAVPAAIAELEAAGIREVQAEAQRQLDEFLSSR